MLDVPELEPLDGVVIVAEVERELDATAVAAAEQAFRLGAADRIVGPAQRAHVAPEA